MFPIEGAKFSRNLLKKAKNNKWEGPNMVNRLICDTMHSGYARCVGGA